MAELSPQTWRALAQRLRQQPWSLPEPATFLGADPIVVRRAVTPLLEAFIQARATPEAIALCFEQQALAQERLQQERDAWQLVWSGPDPRHACTEDTFAVVERLLQQARHSLLISTYNLGESAEIRSLYEALARRLAAGTLQTLEIFFHPIQIADRLGNDPMVTIRTWFREEIWPWDALPQLYIDRRLLSPGSRYVRHHAKCVIADDSVSLVTSANFSEAAQRDNFEAGWLCHSPERARLLREQFQRLVADGSFARVL